MAAIRRRTVSGIYHPDPAMVHPGYDIDMPADALAEIEQRREELALVVTLTIPSDDPGGSPPIHEDRWSLVTRPNWASSWFSRKTFLPDVCCFLSPNPHRHRRRLHPVECQI